MYCDVMVIMDVMVTAVGPRRVSCARSWPDRLSPVWRFERSCLLVHGHRFFDLMFNMDVLMTMFLLHAWHMYNVVMVIMGVTCHDVINMHERRMNTIAWY